MNFYRETSDFMDEAVDMLAAHNAEVGVLPTTPLCFDMVTYRAAEIAGRLRVYAARDDVRKLCGYAVYSVAQHPHYGTLMALQESLYLLPAYRGRHVGSLFLAWISTSLTTEGVGHVFQSVPVANNFGPMLERLGFQPHEVVYHKILERQH